MIFFPAAGKIRSGLTIMTVKTRNMNFIKLNYKKAFGISMKNYYVNMKTGGVSTEIIRSAYEREIYELLDETVGLVKYKVKSTEYLRRGQKDFAKWNFAKDAGFYNLLYSISGFEDKSVLYDMAGKRKLFPTVEESFSRYPKLPSVYLLIMQALDIITLDSYTSLINTNWPTNEISVKYKRIEELSNISTGIGAGQYSDTSYYRNAEFFVRLIGAGKCSEKTCWIFDYFAEPSEVYMKEMNSDNSKKNKSIYSGRVYIDKKNGEILRGELNENVIPIGKESNYVNRKVVLKIKE